MYKVFNITKVLDDEADAVNVEYVVNGKTYNYIIDDYIDDEIGLWLSDYVHYKDDVDVYVNVDDGEIVEVDLQFNDNYKFHIDEIFSLKKDNKPNIAKNNNSQGQGGQR